MTQQYYVDNILPIFCNAIEETRHFDPLNADKYVLQEDGDPSHGKKKDGLAQAMRVQYKLKSFTHPAQSPDLNPIEACWNILKQRVRRRVWRTIEEYKAIVEEEWGKITMEEVRARIAEMPDRCRRLVNSGGKAIKSTLW